MVNLTINDMPITVKEGTTILQAAKQLKINIPTLCHLDIKEMKYRNRLSSCRVCMVENQWGQLIPACSSQCQEGMKIMTDSIKAIHARRTVVELLLSDHPKSCLTCPKNGRCELQDLAAKLDIREIPYTGDMSYTPVDSSSNAIYRNMNKCVLCKRCQTMCSSIQTVGVLTDIGRGFDTVMGTAFQEPMADTNCTFCGQCLAVCPTGAITEVSNIDETWKALASDKTVVVQTAPAVRVALGEEFGLEPGTITTGKMVNALKRLGFDQVYDTNFAADLTIMEEASELVDRLENGGKLPLLTSCCPGWVKFFEHNYQDMMDIPSSAKSPHEMFGAVAKNYLSQEMGIAPEDMIVVSVMPCVAKKFESSRPELVTNSGSDVDIVITTRELATMIREASIDYVNLDDMDFDNPMGKASGAGAIFGTTGGVIEAALRTASYLMTGERLEDVEFEELRGLDGVKEATVNIAGKDLKIAVSHGLGNTRRLLDDIRSGKKNYHAIEIMACPGGCIGGAGQPFFYGDSSIIERRAKAIYEIDKNSDLRCSYENPYIQRLYDKFIGRPYNKEAHRTLHTSFVARPKQ